MSLVHPPTAHVLARRIFALAAASWLAGGLALSPLVAQEVARTPEGVVLDFQDAELRIVIAALADLAGESIVFSDLPMTTVTLRTSGPVSVEQVRSFLRSVAEANGLLVVEEDGLLRVEAAAPQEPAIPTRSPSTDVRLFVHRLRHADAVTVSATISRIFGGTVGPEGAATLSRSGLSSELREDRQLARLGVEPDIATGVQGVPTPFESELRVVADELTNSVLVWSTQADYDVVAHAIEQLDQRPEQVLIEVLIAEVRHNRDLGVGLDVEVPTDPEDPPTQVGGELGGLSVGSLILRLVNLGGVDAQGILSLLATSSDVSILSRPVLLAQNNREARIMVGSQRPFIQLFRALPTDAAVRDQVVQFRDVGTQLTIRPTINPDGYVSLTVLQEVSSATAEVQFGAPVISTREAHTQLLVRDGQTAVIGGLIDRQTESTNSGVPLLSAIPIFGGLFGSTTTRNVSTELFIFITPHVLRTDEELDEATGKMIEGAPRIRKQLNGPVPIWKRAPPLGDRDPK